MTFTKTRASVTGIGSLEAAVLQALWVLEDIPRCRDAGGVTVREIYEEFRRGGRRDAYTSLLGAAGNLVAKSLLSVDMTKTAYLYSSAIPRGDVAREVLVDVINALLGGGVSWARDLLSSVYCCDFCGEAFVLAEDAEAACFDEGSPMFGCPNCEEAYRER